MSIIELHGPFLIQSCGLSPEQSMNAKHVLERAARKKELLFEAKLFADRHFVIGIKDLGDVFRGHLILDCAIIVAVIKSLEVEGLDCFRFPKPEEIAGIDAITKDGCVM